MSHKLILHIGLPKTGTTTIQKSVLSNFDNQLNPFDPDPFKHKVKKQMGVMFRKKSPEDWRSEFGRNTVKDLLQLMEKYEKPLLYSHEGLSYPYFYVPPKQPLFKGIEENEFPVVEHLKEMLKEHPQIGPIRVIVTLRNQTEWLASLYAQHSRYIKNASQSDFETRTNLLLDDHSPKGRGFLFYDSLLKGLSEVVGEKEVFPFFLEEFNTPNFWCNFSKALKIEEHEDSIASMVGKKKNVRRVADKHWQLRPYEGYMKSSFYKRIRRIKIIQEFIKRLYNITVNSNRGTICVPNQLEKKIKEECRESNLQLQNRLGREIHSKYL